MNCEIMIRGYKPLEITDDLPGFSSRPGESEKETAINAQIQKFLMNSTKKPFEKLSQDWSNICYHNKEEFNKEERSRIDSQIKKILDNNKGLRRIQSERALEQTLIENTVDSFEALQAKPLNPEIFSLAQRYLLMEYTIGSFAQRYFLAKSKNPGGLNPHI